ncbi:MAG: hypothetical protein ABSB59_12170 [Streptosporangiaceae bacterium]
MLNSGIVDLAIGMAFIFGATAGLASVITELVARFLGLRGAFLLAGLRELLDSDGTSVVLRNAQADFASARTMVTGVASPADPAAGGAAGGAAGTPAEPSATGAVLGSPILSSQGMTGNISSRHLTVTGMKVKATNPRATNPGATNPGATNGAAASAAGSGEPAAAQKKTGWLGTLSMRRSLPSYISSRSFADAVLGLVIPDASGQTNMGEIQASIGRLPASMGSMKASLQSLVMNAGGDVTKFRTSVEHWYDDHMDRVSGWYKRRTAWITLGVGVILVLLLNINAVTIGRALYSDSAARTAVSTVATQGNPCPAAASNRPDCLSNLEKQVSDAAQAGLPLGWGVVSACDAQKCGWLEQHGITTPGDGSPWQVILALIGFLATIVALTPGAQFWFGLVVKLNSLRSSGPPPAAAS